MKVAKILLALTALGLAAPFASAQTAAELMPSDTARRMPDTRLRMRSSTKRTIVASMKGIEPNTNTISPSSASQVHQPGAAAATASIGAWTSTTVSHRMNPA